MNQDLFQGLFPYFKISKWLRLYSFAINILISPFLNYLFLFIFSWLGYAFRLLFQKEFLSNLSARCFSFLLLLLYFPVLVFCLGIRHNHKDGGLKQESLTISQSLKARSLDLASSRVSGSCGQARGSSETGGSTPGPHDCCQNALPYICRNCFFKASGRNSLERE